MTWLSAKLAPALAFVLAAFSAPRARSAEAPDFLREVRPVLSSYCFKCHGPDDNARKGGLRLDVRDDALKGGKSRTAAIVPGHPEKSELVTRILATNEDDQMPPASVKHPLNARQKQVLQAWIRSGADYRPHWAFTAPVGVTPPSVKVPAFTIRNPIDAFVAARWKQEGLQPSPEADRITLCRRLYLDLIGVPPTPEEADAFAADGSPDAYERLVDKLLASSHYGERWARRWLDLARYADSNGYEKDRDRSIWPYRDWVIRALNADMPFDRFTIEQLAGDLLPNATRDDRVATGFHRNTMLNEEGGIDPLEFRFHAVVDRVNTTGTAWLGLTVGCAQCHTHKYDPILHRDYYQLMAFLNNADEPDLDLPPDDAVEQQRQRERKATRLLAELPGRWPIEPSPLQWEKVQLAVDHSSPSDPAKILDDGSILFRSPGPDAADVTVSFVTRLTNITHLRLETLTDDSLPAKGPGRTPHGNFVLSEISATTSPINSEPSPKGLKFRSATATAEQEGFAVQQAFDGRLDTGWAIQESGKTLNTNHAATLELGHPFGSLEGLKVTLRLQQRHGTHHTIGRLAVALGVPADATLPRPSREEALERAFEQWLERERQRTIAWNTLRPDGMKSNLPLLTLLPDGSVLASGDISKSDTYELGFTNVAGAITAFRLEALPDDSLPAHGPGLAYYEGPKGDFFLGEFKVLADGKPVAMSRATHSYAKNNFGKEASAKAAVDGDPQTGWSCAGRPGEAHQAVFVPETPVEARHLTITMLFGRHYACSLGRFRISVTSALQEAEARDIPASLDPLLRLPEGQWTSTQREQLREQFLLTAPQLSKAAREIRDLRRPPSYPTTLVMRERPAESPRSTFIHKRGEFLQPTDAVDADVPQFLPRLPSGVRHDRLAFARWLVSPENPLTARVVVNRQWAAFFGAGIVGTQNDFGFQGDLPTHPQLLDWLATEFVKDGWSLKALHRRIVTSSIYRQSSVVTPAALARDPLNRWLARGARVRLDAEIIRDSALSASGTLSGKMFGPPVKPPQPAGVTEVAYGSPKWEVSSGEDRYRRSIYTFQKRSAPFAMFNTFDAPSGETCVARREVSDTPLQSLTLLNDIAFVEAAQKLGSLTSQQSGDDETKIRFLFRRVLTRSPSRLESEQLRVFLQSQRARLESGELNAAVILGDDKNNDPKNPPALSPAAWTLVARAVLNLDETITKP